MNLWNRITRKPQTPNFATLIECARKSGCAVEIAGVRIHPCDEYGNDLTRRTVAADDHAVAIRDAVARVLLSATNYPGHLVAHVWGTDMGPLINKVTGAVLAAEASR